MEGARPVLCEPLACQALPETGPALSWRVRRKLIKHLHWVWGQTLLLDLHFQRRAWRGQGSQKVELQTRVAGDAGAGTQEIVKQKPLVR